MQLKMGLSKYLSLCLKFSKPSEILRDTAEAATGGVL